MRKITAGLFITLDGVVEAPEKWNPPYYNDEMTQVVMGQMADADTHLYGRHTYELFRTVFTGPSAPPHGQMMTSAPKIVVSTTLEHPDWGPTTLISSDVAAGLIKLKQQPGKNISTGASGTLVRFLLQQGLLDELSLLVHPVVVGTGKHLFEGGTGQVPLRLLESRPLSNGVVALQAVIDAAPPGQWCWASQAAGALREMKHAVDAALARDATLTSIDSGRLAAARHQYRSAVLIGERETAARVGPLMKKHHALARRLRHREDDYLRFTRDPGVPFDNNAAEREIRMSKLRIKVSGCMRSMTGAENFCAIRSYLSTAAKHGIGSLDALTQAATGSAWIPATP